MSAPSESEDANTTVDATDEADDVPDYEYEPPPHDVLLRLIGNVTVEGSDLTSDDVERHDRAITSIKMVLRGQLVTIPES